MAEHMYLGFDFSTQQLKAVSVDARLNVISEHHVKFDDYFPHYHTSGGVIVEDDNVTITSPTLMWVEALDLLLTRMKHANFQFSKVRAISGSGQQHGSVYWRSGTADLLNCLEPNRSLCEQLKDSFSVPMSPIWMDSSTTKQCKRLEDCAGGSLNLASATGSRAYERFTGNQIAKISELHPQAYSETERISLVSSFGASLFLGRYANIDESDGSGMNLMNIRTRAWDHKLLDVCGQDLALKLGNIVPSNTVLGDISPYFVDAYGFSPECKVVAFTGDNPSSLAGMRLKSGDVAVSLGTSDTLFLSLNDPKPALEGHVFVNPVDTNGYMALLCFKNGSLTREKIRDCCAGSNWDRFNELLSSTPPGNKGNIGIYFYDQEITPFARGCYRYNVNDEIVKDFDEATEIRAVLEGQIIAKRVHAEKLGFLISKDSRILATGGASSNNSILQVIADVFEAPVYVQNVANSASLGAAYRALYGLCQDSRITFTEYLADGPAFVCAAEPRAEASVAYSTLIGRYGRLEERVSAHACSGGNS